MALHHTSDLHPKRLCAHCFRLVGVHNWSKRIARHLCPHVQPDGKRIMCDSGKCKECAK